MTINIITNTLDKNIVLNDIKPYQNIKLFISLLELDNSNDNSDNNEINFDNDLNEYEIKLDVDYKLLQKILDFSLHMYETKNLNITDQDKFNYINEYLNCKYDTIFDLLNTADYLQYDELVDIICEKLADDIQLCDGLDSIKKKFQLNDVLSEEQENELLELLN
tara:strand:- start:97 stop:588 length:492 start_codon:yes stop_codon:yes gene_type:complete